MTNIIFKLFGVLLLVIAAFRDWNDVQSVLFGVAVGLYVATLMAEDLIDDWKDVQHMTFKLERVSNMVFLTCDCDVVFKAWDVSEFSERKLSNALKKLQACYIEPIQLVREF